MSAQSGGQKPYHSLVFRLLLSFFLILLVVFTLGNVITVNLARESLTRQGQQQIQLQRESLERQIEEAERQRIAELAPLLDMLATVAKAPLLNAISEIESLDPEIGEQIAEKFRICLEAPTAARTHNCLELNSRYFMPDAIRAMNRTFITTAIRTILSYEDMAAVVIQGWDDTLYTGYQRGRDDRAEPLQNRETLSRDLPTLQQEVHDDGDYLGKITFYYHTRRIDQMRRDAERQIAESSQRIHDNIAEQSREITLNRIAEGGIFFLIIIVAISLVAFRTIVAPLKSLKHSADQLAQGNLRQAIDTGRNDELGSLSKSFAHMRDAIQKQIDDLNDLNEALQKAEKKYRTLFENSNDVIFIADLDGRIIEINPACESLLGYERAALVQRTLRELLAAPDDYDAFIHLLLEQGVVRHFETVLRRNDGQALEVSVSSSLNRLDDRGRAGFQGIIRDMTAQKKSEQERLRALLLERDKNVAEAANQAKSAFLANISHEIRTPMNAILGFTEIMKEQVQDRQLRHFADSILSSGKSLLNLFNDILDFSRMEADKFTLEFTPFSLRRLLRDIQALFEEKVRQKHIDYAVEVTPDLPDALVFDEMRLKQILTNLVHNAIKFTAAGHVVLTVAGQVTELDMVRLCITVEDTGVGIPDDQLPCIFEAFTQVKGQKHSQFGGAGLGLSITRQLVELMQGEITVTSVMGKGSVFIVTFPSVKVASDTVWVQETSQWEVHPVVADPSIQASPPAAPPVQAKELLTALQMKQSQVQVLLEQMIINEIEVFSREAQTLGQKHGYRDLEEWGASLYTAVHLFDVETIERLLSRFELLMHPLERLP